MTTEPSNRPANTVTCPGCGGSLTGLDAQPGDVLVYTLAPGEEPGPAIVDQVRRVASISGAARIVVAVHGSELRSASEAELAAMGLLKVEDAAELLDLAWGVIANAGEGDWMREHAAWREAAARWRDRYHEFAGQHRAYWPPGTEAIT